MNQLKNLHNALLQWYEVHGRNLPWRVTQDPYAILVSEVMLQQTSVTRVLQKYEMFLDIFPSITHLAEVSFSQVLREWATLGYNIRALRLHKLAREVLRVNSGNIPETPESLRRLPGIGEYTAAAVACFAFGQQIPVVDVNVRRVISRLLATTDLQSPKKFVHGQAQWMLPPGRASDWNQALMDLGATICTARHPRCSSCPVSDNCSSYPLLIGGQSDVHRLPRVPFYGSSRYYRGRIIQILRAIPHGEGLTLDVVGEKIKSDFVKEDEPWLWDIVAKLTKEGLIDLLGCHGQSNTVTVFLAEHPS